MIPSDPPVPKFRWPKKWMAWVDNLLAWLRRTQPMPDPAHFITTEDPHGRFFSLRPKNAIRRQTIPDFIAGPVYTMGSSADGSANPNVWNSAPATSTAQTDTYESWNPPIMTKVNITSVSAANPAVVTATAHGMPATGGPWEVYISGSNSTPSVDGVQWATYISANTYSVPVNVTVAGTAAGWVALRAVGVLNESWIRSYSYGTTCWVRPETIYNEGQFKIGAESEIDVSPPP